MKLTRAGLVLVVAVAMLIAAARLFGLMELYILAAACAVVMALTAIYTATTRLDMAVSRTATPARLRAGTTARIDLVLRNRSSRKSPVMSVYDQLEDGRGASVHVAPLRSQEDARLAYRLPARSRGRLSVGPLDITLGDHLGLTTTTIRAARLTELIVHPKLYNLAPLVAVAGHDPAADQQQIRSIATAGEEFFALRPYVVGDELKRVNWKASARHDDLVVRQDEKPRTGRVTILLDVSPDAYDDAGFERAVSAALSALYAGFHGGDSLRFATSASPAWTEIRTRSELEGVDEQLALIGRSREGSFVQRIEEVTRSTRGGTLVVVGGTVDDSLEKALERILGSFGLLVAVSCQRPQRQLPEWVVIHSDESNFPMKWSNAVAGSQMARPSASGLGDR